MKEVSEEIIARAIYIMGADGVGDDVIAAKMAGLADDAITAQRLIDWIPEAFGIVLVSHSGKVVLPTTFTARSADGRWRTFEFKKEPVFGIAVRLAQHIYHHGPRALFKNLSSRSALTNTVNNALNAGGSVDGAVLSGPSLSGLPAEMYEKAA